MPSSSPSNWGILRAESLPGPSTCLRCCTDARRCLFRDRDRSAGDGRFHRERPGSSTAPPPACRHRRTCWSSATGSGPSPPRRSRRRPGTTVTTIHGGGRTLMPGLIDNHVHITMSASTQDELLDPRRRLTSLQATRHGGGEADAAARLHRRARPGRPRCFGIKPAIDKGKLPGPRIYPSGAMISQTSGHGDSRLPSERSRRFVGEVSRGELLGVNFIADGRDEVLTATRENLRAGAEPDQGDGRRRRGLGLRPARRDAVHARRDEGRRRGRRRLEHLRHRARLHREGRAPRGRGRRQVHRARAAARRGRRCKLLAEKGIWLSLQALDEAPPTAPASRREEEAPGRRGHRQRLQVGEEVRASSSPGAPTCCSIPRRTRTRTPTS